MAKNYGKKFEQLIKEAFLNIENVSIDRQIDPPPQYFGVRNICDFTVYKKPILIYLECKSIRGNTLNFKNISEKQWQGLLEKTNIKGVAAGVIIWFINHDLTVYVPIQELERSKKEGKKSINARTIEEDLDFIEIAGKKKRVYFDYDMSEFFTQLIRKNFYAK